MDKNNFLFLFEFVKLTLKFLRTGQQRALRTLMLMLFFEKWFYSTINLIIHWFASRHAFLGFFFFLTLFYFTILYWFCHTSTWICNGCTRVPNPEPPSHLPPHTISLGHPSTPAPSILFPALNLDWQFVSYMILYMFQCHSPKSSHPLPLPQSPKDCSIHLCLTYRVIVTIFLNSIYMY